MVNVSVTARPADLNPTKMKKMCDIAVQTSESKIKLIIKFLQILLKIFLL